jgi:hypothetical protein
MNKLSSIAVALAAAAVSLPLAAQYGAPAAAPKAAAPAPAAAPAAAPKVMDAAGAVDVTTVTAKIEAVDQANRTVTLKGPMGKVVTLKVGPEVKNLAQVKAGDELVVKYAEALSLKLEKGVEGRSATTTTTGPVGAPAGSMPKGGMATQTTVVANVQSVDAKKQEVLLEGPGGRFVEVKVKDPAVFSSIKPNDKVAVTYTEAIVMEVVAPAAKK